MVTVLEVDVPRKRISLSMKSDPYGKSAPKQDRKKREEKEPEGDLQAKLAMLKGKFGK
jgi:protein Tex